MYDDLDGFGEQRSGIVRSPAALGFGDIHDTIVERDIKGNTDHLLRAAWNAGPELFIPDMQGGSFIAEFRNDTIPRRFLWVIAPQKAHQPVTYPATVISDESMTEKISGLTIMSGYDPEKDFDQVAGHQPGQIAKRLLARYKYNGVIQFDHPLLMGINKREVQDKLRHYYRKFLPPDAFPKDEKGNPTVRTRVGETFEGPFLDEIRDHLMRASGIAFAQFKTNGSTQEQIECARYVMNKMRYAISTVWAYMTKTLNDSELDIKKMEKGGKGKPGYDQPDYRFENPPVPRDAIYLAELNRVELDQQDANSNVDMIKNVVGEMTKQLAGYFQQGKQAEQLGSREEMDFLQKQIITLTEQVERLSSVIKEAESASPNTIPVTTTEMPKEKKVTPKPQVKAAKPKAEAEPEPETQIVTDDDDLPESFVDFDGEPPVEKLDF